MHEAVGQQVELILGEGEHEIVAAVAAEGEGAVVLAEERSAFLASRTLGDVDVAVAHGLHLAVGREGHNFRTLGAHKVEEVLSLVRLADGHHAIQHRGSLNLVLFVVSFHFLLSVVRRSVESLAIYPGTSSSPPLGLIICCKGRAKKSTGVASGAELVHLVLFLVTGRSKC